MDTLTLLGSALGLGLLSGVRLYSTVLAVGLGLRLGWLDLHPALDALAVLASPCVIGVAGVLYLAEFVADKIPWVDTAWDAVHTFIRPLGAALVGAAAFGQVEPALAVAGALLAGGVGATGFLSKAGTRVAVNASPEPFSNVGLSLLEDGLVVGGVWLAIEYPAVMLVLVVVFVAAFLFVVPRVVRLVRRGFRRVRERFRWGSARYRPKE